MTTATHQNKPTTMPAPALHLAHSTRPVIPRDKLLRLPDVESITGLKKSSIYAMERVGKFPKHIAVTRRMSAWPESAVLQWVQDRINQATQVQQ